MAKSIVQKRLVFHFGGFHPTSRETTQRRFVRELDRFKKTWTVDATVSPPEPALGGDAIAWNVTTRGPNWKVDSHHLMLCWEDLVVEAGRESDWKRLPRALSAFASFIGSGTLWGYLRTNWRYAVFFIYPLVLMGVFALVAALVGIQIGGQEWPGAWVLGSVSSLALFFTLVRWPGDLLSLRLMLDDWIFAHAYVRGEYDPRLTQRLDRVARLLVDATRQDADEILVVGHSLGAVLAIDMLARALGEEPNLGRQGPRIGLITIGSSVLKIGLHAGAKRFRACVERVASAPALAWVEYQALKDIMNFYNTDPVKAMGLVVTGKPKVRLVSFRKMFDRSRYKRIRFRPFRLHCQFISGNEKRAPYDYFMLQLGPFGLEQQASAPEGATDLIAADGALIGTAEQAAGDRRHLLVPTGAR